MQNMGDCAAREARMKFTPIFMTMPLSEAPRTTYDPFSQVVPPRLILGLDPPCGPRAAEPPPGAQRQDRELRKVVLRTQLLARVHHLGVLHLGGDIHNATLVVVLMVRRARGFESLRDESIAAVMRRGVTEEHSPRSTTLQDRQNSTWRLPSSSLLIPLV